MGEGEPESSKRTVKALSVCNQLGLAWGKGPGSVLQANPLSTCPFAGKSQICILPPNLVLRDLRAVAA